MVLDNSLLNVLTVYTPYSGKTKEEKESFWSEVFHLVSCISQNEMVVLAGDKNGHVGSSNAGYDGMHGGFVYGDRNADGSRNLRVCRWAQLSHLELGTVISELKCRFEQKRMTGVAQELKTLLLSATNGSMFSVLQSMIEIYSKDIDVRKLRNQLELLPDVILAASHDKVATVRQSAILLDDVQASSPTTKVLMSEVNKLLRIYYMLPFTSALSLIHISEPTRPY